MSRSIGRRSRGAPAALGRTLVAWITLLAMLVPSLGWAGTPYSVRWSSTHDATSCTNPVLAREGAAIFHLNGMPLATYQVPGALVEHDDGSQSNTRHADFDSVLLWFGVNDFHFSVRNVSGDDSCTHAHDVVNLVSEPLGLNKPLFDIRRDGAAFSGDTELDLSLAEINPPLARDIEILLAQIAAERKSLAANAAKVVDLAEKQSLLQQLDTELTDLVKRPLDQIARADLDAILDRYKDVVDSETRAAIEQLIDDLKQSVTDLEDELARLIDEFGAQADSAADFATQAARDAGWNPDDPSGYALGPGDVPWVEVPDISDVPGAFSPGNDPYAAYADAVIAALEGDVEGGLVAERADFVATVRAWRANSAALEAALRERMGVSLAETSAFLNAQNRVTSFVRRFMDASGWLVDTPVPADLRAYVDWVLKPRFGALAEEMKDNLNLWPPGEGLDLEQTQLYQTIDAFAGAMSAIGDGAQAYVDVMGTLVHATSRIAVGFVPYVGPALDLCECITGKSWCLPSGKELSIEERLFSGAGFAVASVGPAWRGVKNAGISPAVAVAAEDIARMGEELATALHASRRTSYKTLRGAVTTKVIDDFEKKVALYLMKDEGRALIGVGDDGVRKVLGIPKTSPIEDAAKAPDFLSVNKGNQLVLSEAKGGKHIDEAVKQLENGMKHAKDLGLAGDVARVETFVPNGVVFDNRDYKILDGYLVKVSDGNKPVPIKGFNKVFVRVIEL
jgi:hypothetical protein